MKSSGFVHEPKPYRVLLYYKYVPLAQHSEYAARHLKFCQALGVRGRVLIAEEGINGTLSGTIDQCEAYINALQMDPRFEDMVFKIDEVEKHVFGRLSVKPVAQLVNFGEGAAIDPNELTGEYLNPIEFFQAMQDEKDVIILDGRNDYEYDLGHFRGAIRPDVKSFREFPRWIRKNLKDHKDKPILTYCTGGIRCEKLSGYLINEGFSKVSQLRGGIASYGKDDVVQGRLFEGSMYVFDERIAVRVNRTEDASIITKCLHCGAAVDRLLNCANLECHEVFVCCRNCEQKHRGACSAECEQAPKHSYKAAGDSSISHAS